MNAIAVKIVDDRGTIIHAFVLNDIDDIVHTYNWDLDFKTDTHELKLDELKLHNLQQALDVKYPGYKAATQEFNILSLFNNVSK